MISIHRTPILSTPWHVEKQISMLYMHNVFKIFQKEVVATRDQGRTQARGRRGHGPGRRPKTLPCMSTVASLAPVLPVS
jgi:hypothetical protein